MVGLDRHHQIAGVFERIRVLAQRFLGIQQLLPVRASVMALSANFSPSLMFPKPM
jgi:hypothetical protein